MASALMTAPGTSAMRDGGRPVAALISKADTVTTVRKLARRARGEPSRAEHLPQRPSYSMCSGLSARATSASRAQVWMSAALSKRTDAERTRCVTGVRAGRSPPWSRPMAAR